MSEHNDVTCADPHDVAAVGLSPQVGFSAQGTLVGVTEVDVQTGAHTFKVDEPPALGGADAAANPVQYALASLGSGFFGVDDTVRPGFTAVRVEVSVTGPDAPERYDELAAAVDQHCPVLDLFQNPVPVTRAISTP